MDVVKRLGRKSIRVTDIAAQYWCEMQMELRYIYGAEVTKEAKAGSEIHEIIEKEVNIPIILEAKSYADYVYKMLYTDYIALRELKKNGRARELSIFGNVDGFAVSGKIDELRMENGIVSIIEDKTKRYDNIPKDNEMLPHKIQVMFYRLMLDSINSKAYTMESFSRFYGTGALHLTNEFIRQLDAMNVEKGMQSVAEIERLAFNEFASLGKVSDMLHIRYINQLSGKLIKEYKFKYNAEELAGIKDYVMKYWKGERQAKPVSYDERWKCNYCVFFGNKCKVWFKDKQKVLA